jgi:hypothetical protein
MSITIHGCDDCGSCINYDGGFRIVCGNPELPPDEIYKYYPVNEDLSENINAENCEEFSFSFQPYLKWFTEKQLMEAQQIWADAGNKAIEQTASKEGIAKIQAGEKIEYPDWHEYMKKYAIEHGWTSPSEENQEEIKKKIKRELKK